MASEIRLRVRDIADQFGVPASLLLSVVQFSRLEAQRDSDGALTYDLDEFQDAYVEFNEKQKNTQLENAAELLKRILPDIQQRVAETVEQRMVLAIGIRDQKEQRLVETLAAVSQMVVRLDATTSFLVKLAAQINAAAVAGIATAMPTAGVAGAWASFGTGIGLGAEKKLGTEPAEAVMPAFKRPDDADYVISGDARDDAKEVSPGVATELAKEEGEGDTGGDGAGEVGGVTVEKKRSSSVAAKKLGDKASHSRVAAAAARQPESQEEIVGGSRVGSAVGRVGSGVLGGVASVVAGVVGTGTGTLAAMLPPGFPLTPAQQQAVQDNLGFFEHLLTKGQADLKSMSASECSTVDETLRLWEEHLADCPQFVTFYSALSRIKAWVAAKSGKVPPLVMFLALNRIAPGATTPQNFLLITGA